MKLKELKIEIFAPEIVSIIIKEMIEKTI